MIRFNIYALLLAFCLVSNFTFGFNGFEHNDPGYNEPDSICTLEVIEASAGVCNDNGTPSYQMDDWFDVTIFVQAMNPGSSGNYFVTSGSTNWGPFSYETQNILPGLLVAESPITLNIFDIDDPSCSTTTVVSQFPCSWLCELSVVEAWPGVCDDNGSPADSSDDFYDVFVSADVVNSGSTYSFVVTDGITEWGPFSYSATGVITGLPTGVEVTLTVMDAEYPDCNSQVTVFQDACSDSCLPNTMIQTQSSDVYIDDACFGIIMKAPNGNCFRYKAANDGSLSSELVPCPE